MSAKTSKHLILLANLKIEPIVSEMLRILEHEAFTQRGTSLEYSIVFKEILKALESFGFERMDQRELGTEEILRICSESLAKLSPEREENENKMRVFLFLDLLLNQRVDLKAMRIEEKTKVPHELQTFDQDECNPSLSLFNELYVIQKTKREPILTTLYEVTPSNCFYLVLCFMLGFRIDPLPLAVAAELTIQGMVKTFTRPLTNVFLRFCLQKKILKGISAVKLAKIYERIGNVTCLVRNDKGAI